MIKPKHVTAAAICLLLSVVVLSPMTVQGVHISTTWGSRFDQIQADKDEMTYTSDYITNYAFNQPSWARQNAWATAGLTTGYNIITTARAIRDNPNYDFAATFHFGHYVFFHKEGGQWVWDDYYGWIWAPDGTQIRHYGYYGDRETYAEANNVRLQDDMLYSNPGDKHRFTVIWTCVNGDLKDTNGDGIGDSYGWYDSVHNTGAVGVPYAWSGTTGMNINGYANPDYNYRVYMGFENISRGLSYDSIEFNGNYGLFVRYLYYNAGLLHRPVITSLDDATKALTNYQKQYFWQTELYNGYEEYGQGQTWKCKMRVFGDGSMVLPY